MKPADQVRLGYELASGREVLIPIRHMAVTGQTQEAGKTTALEAMVSRSGMQAVTFITKRGEVSFTGARRIAPYFREQADWQFVASVLEASRGEKLKWERAAIITASRGATRLADVHRNIKTALAGKKATRWEKEYICLDAYLDVVVPAIGRVQWAPTLDLQPGINAVDLTAIPAEMQHLVIKSCMDWVLDRAERTIVVIPEAWKFIPESRNTPVKLSALALIRQGAALKNYVWLDSQDLGGVDKEILRSVAVWLLGVQREANEIKRTLSNIPDGVAKPKRSELAQLELGVFYACWGRQTVLTYVQPAWMSSEDARACVTGGMDFRDALHRALDEHKKPLKETIVIESEARDLREVNQRLQAENADLRKKLDELLAFRRPAIVDELHDRADRPLVDQVQSSSTVVGEMRVVPGSELAQRASARPKPESRPVAAPFGADDEARYQAFRARLIAEANEDPTMLQILLNRPELQVTVRREVIQVVRVRTPDGEPQRFEPGTVHRGCVNHPVQGREVDPVVFVGDVVIVPTWGPRLYEVHRIRITASGVKELGIRLAGDVGR